MRALSFILIFVGAVMLFSNSFSFITKEKIIDAGPIHISADKKREVNWPTYAGGIVMAVGVILLIVPKKKR
jgi:predicted membrane protein